MAPKKKTTTKTELSFFKLFLYVFLVGFVMMIFIGYSVLSGNEYRDHDSYMPEFNDPHSDDTLAVKEKITEPIVIWWTGFTAEPGRYRKCGEYQCFFTIDRHYHHHPKTKVFAFYGTEFNPKDLPMPRKPDHDWALLHEESPKNNYIFSYIEALELFNHTATFSRHSDLPLLTQHLDSIPWLESEKYLVPTREKNHLLGELAPILYVQSDCGTPANRDEYVRMLMQEIKVDSYGVCLQNKHLPEHLVDPIAGYEHADFYKLTARYKFTIAMENAICDDYVTEKVWRPLMLGSVPIIAGSPKIRDVLPDNHSAIIIDEFKSIKELADYLKYLNDNDEEYNKYLQWKKTGVTNKWLLDHMKQRTWSVSDTWRFGRTNFVEDFECLVCKRVQENIKRENRGQKKETYIPSAEHFGCPEPKNYDSAGKQTKQSLGWLYDWRAKRYEAKALRYFADRNIKIVKGDFNAKVSELKYYDK